MEQEPSIERQIEEMLAELRDFGWVFNEFPELQDEWYDVEMGAEASRDRDEAAEELGAFLEKVKARAAQRGEG